MKNDSFIFYSDFINEKNDNGKQILVSKTNKSYLIGPLINNCFDKTSFIKRLKSNCIYEKELYKKCRKNKIRRYIKQYYSKLKNNEVIEVFSDNNYVIHKIIKLPGDLSEK